MKKLISIFVLFFSGLCLANLRAEVRYVDCVDGRSAALSTAFVLPLKQSELTRLGPSVCSEQCLYIDRTFSYFLVHVPAGKQFVNQLVCACVTEKAFEAVPSLDDDLCHLPCPKGNGHFIDAVNLTGIYIQDRNVDDSLLPKNRPRFLGLSGLMTSSDNRQKGVKKTPKNHFTCGDGLGLLSVYEIDNSSPGPIKSLPIVVLLFISFLNPL